MRRLALALSIAVLLLAANALTDAFRGPAFGRRCVRRRPTDIGGANLACMFGLSLRAANSSCFAAGLGLLPVVETEVAAGADRNRSLKREMASQAIA